MYRQQHGILKALALAIAVAALAAPTALAEPRGPSNPLDSKSESATSTSPDDRSFARGPAVAKNEQERWVSPDDRPLPRGAITQQPASSRVVSSRSGAFQWWEAGVGAATMLAVCLLAGATTFVVRHQRGRMATS